MTEKVDGVVEDAERKRINLYTFHLFLNMHISSLYGPTDKCKFRFLIFFGDFSTNFSGVQ